MALLLIVLLLPILGCAKAEEPKPEKLSDLSDEKLVEYLISLGLEIPEGCDVPEDNAKMIRHYVEELEKDPNWTQVVNMYWNFLLFLRVKVVVSKFYGHDDIAEETQNWINKIEVNDRGISDPYAP